MKNEELKLKIKNDFKTFHFKFFYIVFHFYFLVLNLRKLVAELK